MITLELGERTSHFSEDGRPLTGPLPLGVSLLRERWLRHDPPQPQELEAAIEAVEDVVMPLHRVLPAGDTLRVMAPEAGPAAFAPLVQARTRDELEALFDRAAAIAQGRPARSDPALSDPQGMAALVIVREVMHHLGFTQLRFAPR
jgi:hypothetical protein